MPFIINWLIPKDSQKFNLSFWAFKESMILSFLLYSQIFNTISVCDLIKSKMFPWDFNILSTFFLYEHNLLLF